MTVPDVLALPTSRPVGTATGDERAAADFLVHRAWGILVTDWEGAGVALGWEHAHPALQRVLEFVQEAMDGRPISLGDVSPLVAQYRLVDRVRAAVVAAADEAALYRHGLYQVVSAIETVARAIDADCRQRFVGRLSGPAAAALVVELAHDMRSALGSIMFLSETLRSGATGPVSPAQVRQLGLVYSAALGLNGIVNDVMDLARGAGRLFEREPVPFMLRDVVSSVATIIRPTAEEKGIEIQLAVPDVGIRLGHPAALTRVLLNLLTNAIKFTETGSVRLAVEAVNGSDLVFRISDTGRGIPPDLLGSLLESFRARRDASADYFSSAGLGLSMCQTLLEGLSSTLEVQSEEGVGTTFSFSLRLTSAPRLGT